MLFYVIEVMKDGKKKYVKETSIFSREPLVDDPLEAKRYKSEDPHKDHELANDLSSLRCPTDTSWARSALKVDSKPVVVGLSVNAVEFSRTEQR